MKTSQEVMAMQWEARGCEVWASPDTSEYICIASSELLADFIAAAPALRALHDRLRDACRNLVNVRDSYFGKDEQNSHSHLWNAVRSALKEVPA